MVSASIATVLALLCCSLLFPSIALLVPPHSRVVNRRNALLTGASSMLGIVMAPHAANAESGSNTLNELLAKLRPIPTYCIVNPQGVPYMKVIPDERLAKGYAFTSFEGGLAVLADAKKAAETGGYAEVWEDATITLIPGDVAMRLALQKIERKNKKGQSLDTVYDLIPSATHREDAMQYDKRFSDQGKVPLFYFDGLTLPSKDGSTQMTPMFFSKTDLLSEWKRQYPDEAATRTKVVDLLDIFLSLIRGRGSGAFPENMVFIQSQKELELAKELKSRGLAPYKTDTMIL